MNIGFVNQKNSSGMSMLIMMVLVTSTKVSPLMMTMMVTGISINLTVMATFWGTSTFSMAAVLISFSSGMMIMFSYCSILVNYEKKSNSSSKMMLLMCAMIMMVTEETMSSSLSSEISSSSSQLQVTMLAMAMVIMVMLGINKMMVTPQKSMLMTY